MTRITIFIVSIILVGAFCCSSGKPDDIYSFQSASKPTTPMPDGSKEKFNVILISIDTLRADRLNCYGYNKHKTSPNIDALARDSILYENFITAAPWTTPAHLSMLTSLNPSSHGMTSSFGEMWSALYRNGGFFQLPDHRTTLAEVLKNAGLRTTAFTAGGPMDPKLGFEQGFEKYHTTMHKLNNGNVGSMFKWIEANSKNHFFLFWHQFQVHAPYLNTDFLLSAVPGEKGVALKAAMDALAENPTKKPWPHGATRQWKKQKKILKDSGFYNPKVCEALYLGGILESDRWLGKLVSVLKKQKLYDNTLIVITSDHGEEFSEHHKRLFYNNHGHSMYEEMIKVPLIIKAPHQYAAGTRVSQNARTIDIMPTILDVLKISPKKNEMQGVSLATDWPDVSKMTNRPAFTECTTGKSEKKSIRTDRYKYIMAISKDDVKKLGRSSLPETTKPSKLFDLEKDPSENNDLLKSKLLSSSADTSKKMAGKFDKQIRKHISNQKGEAVPVQLSEDAIERIKGLGYME